MNGFIILHSEDTEVYIRASHISSFEEHDCGTKVYLLGDSMPYEVDETSSEIIELIKKCYEF